MNHAELFTGPSPQTAHPLPLFDTNAIIVTHDALSTAPQPMTHASGVDPLHLALAELMPALTGYFLRRLGDREDAADATADTLVALLAKPHNVPRDPDDIRRYTFGVARNVLAAVKRGRVLHHELATRIGLEVLVDPHPSVAKHQIDPDLDRALSNLPEKERELVLLVAWEGFGVAEAGAILGWKPEAARKRYSRVRAKLRAALAST